MQTIKPQLDQALEAAEQSDLDEALECLIEAWRIRPVPSVADLSWAVDELRTVPGWPRWDEHEAEVDVHFLVRRLPGSFAKLLDRTRRLCAERDPRVGIALERLVGDLQSGTRLPSKWSWEQHRTPGRFRQGQRARLREMVAEVARTRDPRFVGLPDRFVHSSEWEPFQRTIDEAWAGRFPCLDSTEQAVLDSLESAVSALRDEHSRAAMDRLLEAVAAEPEADAPRLALMDALLEAGDPHGWFLADQLGMAKRGLRARRRWLGVVGSEVHVIRWDRGFPAAVIVEPTNRLHATIGHPSWRLIRSFAFNREYEASHTLVAFLDCILGWAEDLDLTAPWMVERVLQLEAPGVRRLRIRCALEADLRQRLCAHRGLQLERFHCLTAPPLTDAAWWPGLNELEIEDRSGFWALRLGEHPTLESVRVGCLGARRGADGRLSALWVHNPHHYPREELHLGNEWTEIHQEAGGYEVHWTRFLLRWAKSQPRLSRVELPSVHWTPTAGEPLRRKTPLRVEKLAWGGEVLWVADEDELFGYVKGEVVYRHSLEVRALDAWGDLVAVADRAWITILDGRTGQVIRRVARQTNHQVQVRFRPGGKMLAIAEGGRVAIRSKRLTVAESGLLRIESTQPELGSVAEVQGEWRSPVLAWSADGRSLAIASEVGVHVIWDLDNPVPQRLAEPPGARSVTWVSGEAGNLVCSTCSWSSRMFLMSIGGQPVDLKGLDGIRTDSVQAIPGLLAAALPGGVAVFDTRRPDRLGRVAELTGRYAQSAPLAWSGSSRTLAIGRWDHFELWSCPTPAHSATDPAG